MSDTNRQIRVNLKTAYDQAVNRRDHNDLPAWKSRERSEFLTMLKKEGKQSLIDIGSGPGIHASFFSNGGLHVTCVDLSPAMVERCREKGLEAYELDAINLPQLDRTFDAAFAMNSLLHIPRKEFAEALRVIRDILNANGIFYLGQYGGVEIEGTYDEDVYEPNRYFSRMSDESMKFEVSEEFTIERFKNIKMEDLKEGHYQALLLRGR